MRYMVMRINEARLPRTGGAMAHSGVLRLTQTTPVEATDPIAGVVLARINMRFGVNFTVPSGPLPVQEPGGQGNGADGLH